MSFDELLKKHYVKILAAILVIVVLVGVLYYFKKEKYMYDSNSGGYDNMENAYGNLPKVTITYNPESIVNVYNEEIKQKAADAVPFIIIIALSNIQLSLGKRVHSRVIATSDSSLIPKGYNGVVQIVDPATGSNVEFPFGKTPAKFLNDLISIHKRIKNPVAPLSKQELENIPFVHFSIDYNGIDQDVKNRLPGILVNATNHIQQVLGMSLINGHAGNMNAISVRLGGDEKTYSLGTDLSSLGENLKNVISYEIRSDIH